MQSLGRDAPAKVPDLEGVCAQRDIDLFEFILERRKDRVAFHLAKDNAEIELTPKRQRLRVNLRAADDKKFALRTHALERGEQSRQAAHEPDIAIGQARE